MVSRGVCFSMRVFSSVSCWVVQGMPRVIVFSSCLLCGGLFCNKYFVVLFLSILMRGLFVLRVFYSWFVYFCTILHIVTHCWLFLVSGKLNYLLSLLAI
jgi:hypothetical protein